MADPRCDSVRADLAEAALALLDEPIRSDVLAHVSTCPECRAELDEYVRVADRLLASAPEAEPPPGFEQRVLARLEGTARDRGDDLLLAGSRPMPARAPRRWRARPLVAAVAVTGALAIGVAVGVGVTRGEGDGRADELADALASVGIEQLAMAELRNDDGEEVGWVAVARDGAPVMLMRFSQFRVGVPYRCQLELADGRLIDVGEWKPAHEHDYGWAAPLPALTSTPVEARVLRPDGTVWATGTLG